MDPHVFITEMNNSDEYKNIFNTMVVGRSLLLVLDERDLDDASMTVAHNLLHPKPRFRLNWNNVADKVPIMRIEANYILRELRRIGERADRFEPSQYQRDQADTLIFVLNKYLKKTAATAMPITYNIDEDEDADSDTEGGGLRKRKRKRKSIKIKSRKSKKSRKSRKSRKSIK